MFQLKQILAGVTLAVLMMGCGSMSTSETLGTVGGAVAGGAIGSAVGGGTVGTIGGAAVGAVVGQQIGKSFDN